MKESGGEFWFDEQAADRVCNFFKRYLAHSKGEWAGKPFELQPWQRTLLRDVFGWKRQDGTRRYRRVFVEVARGNGKSTLAAGIALYLLTADSEPGAEIYSAAASAQQAAIVFDEAKRMLQASAKLSQRVRPFRNSLVMESNHSAYRVLSADADVQHGLNAHGIIFDELHTQKSRDLWDVLTTSTIKRRQPLTVALTTAGHDRETICFKIHEHAERVALNPEIDPEFYPALFCAGQTDAIDTPETWAKANPSLGVTIKHADMEREAQRARTEPSYENTFRRLHLCQWTQQADRWLPLDAWDRCGTTSIIPANYEGMECYAGLDLSNTRDLTALTLVFPQPGGTYHVLPFFWCPRDTARTRGDEDGVDYLVWARQGHLELTDGNTIDYELVRRRINELAARYQIKEIVVDEYNAWQLIQQLQADGFTVIPRRTTDFKGMNAPSKELERLVMAGLLQHGNQPVLRWCAANIAVKEHEGNIRPTKAHATGRIDGVIAVILGLSRAMLSATQAKPKRSVYEGRGIILI